MSVDVGADMAGCSGDRDPGLHPPKGGASLQTGGAGWYVGAREQASERVAQIGRPNRRDEYWKFTNPAEFCAPVLSKSRMAEEPSPVMSLEHASVLARFREGRLDEVRRRDAEGTGLEVTPMSGAISDPDHWSSRLFGKLEAAGQRPVGRGLAAENTRDANEGLFVRCHGQVPCVLHIDSFAGSAAAGSTVHHVIQVQPGADLTIMEEGSVSEGANVVFEVDVSDGGKFSHIRVQDTGVQSGSINHIFARVGERGEFSHFSLTANHLLVRNECVVELAGQGGSAHLAGAVIGGAESHHDDTILVIHGAEDCQSRQVYKKVLHGGSRGVFQGKILVRKGAQQTDGYQISKGLLIGEDSQFLAKPELEIYADDVVCSHGSTSGSADAGSLFYLRARGIPEPEALNLLAMAFLAETLQEIRDEKSAEILRQRIGCHLANQSHVLRG